MWRQCLMAGFPAHVRLSPEVEGGSSCATRTFSSQISGPIINKATVSLKWQRTCSLIVMPPCIWSKMLKWWKVYASLCVFCSARELRFATKLQLCCAQAACVRPEARQQGLKAALDQDGDYYAPSALLARGLHREQALALVRPGLLPLLFGIQSSSSSIVQFPWLSVTSPCANWPQSLLIQNFHPIKTKGCCCLAEVLILQPLYMWHSHWIWCR